MEVNGQLVIKYFEASINLDTLQPRRYTPPSKKISYRNMTASRKTVIAAQAGIQMAHK